MIIEFDVTLFDRRGEAHHLGTFKSEIRDGLLGYVPAGRVTHSPAFRPLFDGRVEFSVITRPKNRPVIEESE